MKKPLSGLTIESTYVYRVALYRSVMNIFSKSGRSEMTSTNSAVSECQYSKKCSRYDQESYTCTHMGGSYCGHYKAIKGIRP